MLKVEMIHPIAFETAHRVIARSTAKPNCGGTASSSRCPERAIPMTVNVVSQPDGLTHATIDPVSSR